MRWLVAIPVYNEARHVRSVLDQVRRFTPDILVVDDGSTDETPHLLAREPGLRVVTHRPNRGYGAAIASAFKTFLATDFDVLVTMDCDGPHERLAYYRRILAAAEWEATPPECPLPFGCWEPCA